MPRRCLPILDQGRGCSRETIASDTDGTLRETRRETSRAGPGAVQLP